LGIQYRAAGQLHRFQALFGKPIEEETTMSHFDRLQLAGRITYYLGWIALVCGGLTHFNIATGLFSSVDLTQRNLFELSVVSFLICVASELRAIAGSEKTGSAAVVRQAAA
jgi:hypothetical protein